MTAFIPLPQPLLEDGNIRRYSLGLLYATLNLLTLLQNNLMLVEQQMMMNHFNCMFKSHFLKFKDEY